LSTHARLLFFQQGKFGTKVATDQHQMTQKIASLAAIAFLLFGCSRSGKVQRNQQQYQTVQEGSASGVTSTINAPGETTPPMTNTNVDTTTNLTLPTNPAPLGNDTAGGSMASGMPSYPTGTPGMAPAPRPRTSARITNAPVVTDTIGSTTPAMPRERTQPAPREQRPQTDTASTDTTAPPPPTTDTTMTDTSSTTSTSTSTDTKKKKDDGKKKESDQPPPPPPPTATDTRG
jgi:hypothetical protein